MTRRAVPAAPGVCFDLWNELPTDRFLADDRDNPARAMAAEIVQEEVRRLGGDASLVEIGPGPGFDYGDHFKSIPGLCYLGLEGSRRLLTHCQQQYPQADFQPGGFEALMRLRAGAYDIGYVKAVFEHQEDFREPLKRLLRVVKHLALINWYLPPGATELRRYNKQERMYYNRYAADDVQQAILAAGFKLEIRTAPSPGNALYICRRS